VLQLTLNNRIMAGCFGNHPVDRYIEQQLFQHLKEEDEADELAELEEEMEEERRRMEEEEDNYPDYKDFENHDYDTDAFGNCYSDADPGL
jgi:hypothetical protein